MKNTVLITGASSGFGKLIAKKFQSEGWNVVATMRSPQKETELNQLENVLVTELDVTKPNSIAKAIITATDKFGTIDALVNNAGLGIAGPMEGISNDEIRNQMDVNLFGPINTMKAVLPQMRAKKSGTIINVSSIGGRVAFPYFSVYMASKHALEGLTDSMQYELDPFGIRLKLVEPGVFKTAFGENSTQSETSKMADYHETNQKFYDKYFKTEGSSLDDGDPQQVADAVYEAATDNSEQLRYPVGASAIQTLGARQQMSDIDFKNMMKQHALAGIA
ncbi:MAG: SDR family oxidoreductase [Sneathiella sp.]|nr:SDR family oxidoreductase [Sneathiella sp.]